ncbi:hypothetical protein [Pelagibacterium sp.]|uniref:hypothetical protein n=1 Tax=Pelagibacterium sp. TaxID=1967288 RepID=UPI003C7BAB2B
MPQILLENDPIDDLEIEEIITRATKPDHALFESGRAWDFLQNLKLLELFDDRKILDIKLGMLHFKQLKGFRPFHTDEFTALRFGKLLSWGLHKKIVRHHGGALRWRLLHSEMQYEMCGPAVRQRAVRVRNVKDCFEAAEAHQIWQKELKRRERVRARYAEKMAAEASEYIDFIIDEAPETKLPDPIASLAVADHDTIAACRDVMIIAMRDLGVEECRNVHGQLRRAYRKVAVKAKQQKEADMDAIADLTDFL